MLHIGRLLLLILSFLSLQLSLFSGGEGCRSALAHVAGAATMAGMDMAGMDMAGMDMAGMDMAGMDMAGPHGDGQSSTPSSHHDKQSCDANGSRTNCDSMTVCVFAAETARVGVRDAQRLPAVRAPMLAMRTPPTEGAAPDLPPPRLQS